MTLDRACVLNMLSDCRDVVGYPVVGVARQAVWLPAEVEIDGNAWVTRFGLPRAWQAIAAQLLDIGTNNGIARTEPGKLAVQPIEGYGYRQRSSVAAEPGFLASRLARTPGRPLQRIGGCGIDHA